MRPLAMRPPFYGDPDKPGFYVLMFKWLPDKRIGWTPWLDVFCPGCGTSRAIDLRKVDRHPLASVATLVLGLRCAWCPEAVSMPRTLGLHTLPPPAKAVASNLDPGTLSNPRRSGGLHRGPPKPRCRPPGWHR